MSHSVHLPSRKEISFLPAFKATVNTGEKVFNCIEFTEFCTDIQKSLGNFHGKIQEDEPLGKSSQSLYPNWQEEVWNIWKDFGSERAKEIIIALHSRKTLEKNQETNRRVLLNGNSFDFFRDTNLSLSIFDEELGKEIALIGFFVLPGKKIEIFQLQGRKKYGASEKEFEELLERAKVFFRELGFSKLLILKSQRNYLSHKPNHTKKFSSSQQEQEWLIKHRERMAITYDANPLRKWGFSKPEDSHEREFYSAEFIL